MCATPSLQPLSVPYEDSEDAGRVHPGVSGRLGVPASAAPRASGAGKAFAVQLPAAREAYGTGGLLGVGRGLGGFDSGGWGFGVWGSHLVSKPPVCRQV